MEQNINFDRMEQAAELFGSFDENIRLIEKEYHVTLLFRDSELKITGDEENVARAVRTIRSLLTLLGSGETLTEQNVRYCMRMVEEDSEERCRSWQGTVSVSPARESPSSRKQWDSALTATISGTIPSP